ncbi:uncharacterized protein LOC142322910 [Lycorma delicatula]|uniref:uncharacterized protein LOC142322910 n=1 Tax=Lycorma delicatula TaxID=130591 RepID=UPI003F5150B0
MSSLVLGVPLTLVTILGLLVNGYIFLMVLLSKQIHTANNLLLLHLGFVDSLLCSVFLLFSASGLARAGSTSCTVHGFLFTLLHPVALWTVCGLNCDRYYAISAPLHYGALVSPRRVAVGLGATWLLSLVLCLPPLFITAPYCYNSALSGCAPDFANGEPAFWYSAIYTLFTLILPAALILGCNLKVLMIARYHRHRIASAIFEVTLSAQVTITHQRNPFFLPGGVASKFKGRSAISKVLQLLGSFMLLYFPYYGIILWESSSSTFLPKSVPIKAHPHLVMIASTLLTFSPPVNGLLYGVKSKVLRKSFQNYWRKQMTKSEVNHEIQARTPSACGSRRPSLTPLGILNRPGGAMLQRRLSEAFIEPQKSGFLLGASPRSKIQRIASELSWRPVSTSGLTFTGVDINTNQIKRSKSFRNQHAASFSTLQVPNQENETNGHIEKDELIKSFRVAVAKTEDGDNHKLSAVKPVIRSSISNTSLFVQKVIGAGNIRFNLGESGRDGTSDKPIRRSPRILITRAFSEESDQKTPSSPGTPPAKLDLGRKHSSASTLIIGNKWRDSKTMLYEDVDENIHVQRDLSSPGASSTSSNEDKCFPKENGMVLLQEDVENCSDGGESIVWMKPTPERTINNDESVSLNISSDDSELCCSSESNNPPSERQEPKSWPYPKRKKHFNNNNKNNNNNSSVFSEDESSFTSHRHLRTSNSLSGISDKC